MLSRRAFIALIVAISATVVVLGIALGPNVSPAPPRGLTEKDASFLKGSASQVNFEDLARDPTRWKNMTVTVTGKVIQVLEEGDVTTLRINITRDKKFDFWNDTIMVGYRRPANMKGRILENDVVAVYGTYQGVTTYKSIFGQPITIPLIFAGLIEPN